MPVALIPSFALLASTYGVLLVVGADIRTIAHPGRSVAFRELFGVVIFAPIAETFLLALGLQVLHRVNSRPLVAITASAVAWGLLHALVAPVWFFGTVWSFFVFSAAYFGWRPHSFRHAFVAAAVPHALLNFIAMALLGIVNAA